MNSIARFNSSGDIFVLGGEAKGNTNITRNCSLNFGTEERDERGRQKSTDILARSALLFPLIWGSSRISTQGHSNATQVPCSSSRQFRFICLSGPRARPSFLRSGVRSRKNDYAHGNGDQDRMDESACLFLYGREGSGRQSEKLVAGTRQSRGTLSKRLEERGAEDRRHCSG